MNRIKRLVAGAALVTGVALILAGCTVPTEEKTETQEAITTYETFIDEVYNHGVDADTLINLNKEVVPLAAEGKQDEALVILNDSGIINTNHVMLASQTSPNTGEDIERTMSFALSFRVLGIMSLNSINDVVSVEIDPTAVKYVDKVYEIKRSGVKFSSERNSETTLADTLNKEIGYQSDKDTTINVIETTKGLKVDLMSTDF